MDAAAIDALGAGLENSQSPFIAVSGLMGMPKGRLTTETDAIDPKSVGGPRSVNEHLLFGFANRGVRAMVVRFPLFVHGAGDQGGFLPTAVRAASKNKISGFEVDGSNRLPATHRRDAAHLLRLGVTSVSLSAKAAAKRVSFFSMF
jgi:nucleoside-diphosphate-sugar epimerase